MTFPQWIDTTDDRRVLDGDEDRVYWESRERAHVHDDPEGTAPARGLIVGAVVALGLWAGFLAVCWLVTTP